MKEELTIRNEKISLITKVLCLFYLVIPFDTLKIFKGISLPKIIAILVIISSIGKLPKNKKIFISSSTLLLIILSIFTFIQILYTRYTASVSANFLTLLLYTLMILLISQIKFNSNEKRVLIKSFACMSIICIVLLILFPYTFEGRMTICFPNMKREDPNQFAGYLLPGIIYVFYNLFIVNKKDLIISKILYFFLFIVYVYFLLMTGSRGGLLAVCLGILCLILIESENSKLISFNNIKKVIFIFVSILVFYVFINFLPNELITRFNLLEAIISGGTGRTNIWNIYINIFNDSDLFYKIFGYGIGSSTSLYYKVAHNTWIEMLVTGGIIGLIIFSTFIFSILKNFKKTNNKLMFSIFVGTLGLTVSLSLLAYKPIWILTLLSVILLEKKGS